MATREETKKMIEVMQHYVDGGEVEMEDCFGNWQWQEAYMPSWNWIEGSYRIKATIPKDFMNEIEDVLSELEDGDEVEFLISSSKVSEAIQDVLFQYGYRWSFNGTKSSHVHAECLFIRSKGMSIQYHNKIDRHEIDCLIVIDLKNQTIKDLRPKTEELTVAEIEAKLGYKVKIVKEGN